MPPNSFASPRLALSQASSDVAAVASLGRAQDTYAANSRCPTGSFGVPQSSAGAGSVNP
jgi:hypothetical protein